MFPPILEIQSIIWFAIPYAWVLLLWLILIQTMYLHSLDALLGVHHISKKWHQDFVEYAKRLEKVVVIVGHVKRGWHCRPKTLNILIVYWRQRENGTHIYRLVESSKKQIGPTRWSWYFEDEAGGNLLEIAKPSDLIGCNNSTRSGPITQLYSIWRQQEALFLRNRVWLSQIVLPVPRRA